MSVIYEANTFINLLQYNNSVDEMTARIDLCFVYITFQIISTIFPLGKEFIIIQAVRLFVDQF